MKKGNTINYQALFRSLPGRHIAMLPDSPHYTIVAETESHEEVAMVKPGEVIGKPFLEAFPDTSEEFKKTGTNPILKSFDTVVKTGKPDTMPPIRYDLKGPDGNFVTRFWQATHYPIFDEERNLILIFQDTKDISDEVSVQTQLQQAQQQLREALSSGIIGTWLWDIRKDIVIGDEYMAAMFGMPALEVAKGLPLESFTNHIYPDDKPRVMKEIAKVLETGAIYNIEYRTLRKDGSIRWVIARGQPERNEDGESVQFPGVLFDITDRKINENNLIFLAKAGAVLSESLDYNQTLRTIAELAVPTIADWCTVELLNEKNELVQVAVQHKDPEKIKLIYKFRELQGPRTLDQPNGVSKVIKTGKSEYIPEISDDILAANADSEEELKILRKLGLTSAIIVPLNVRGRTVGAIMLISAEQKRYFTKADLAMFEELGRRASISMTNASLYEEAQNEIAARQILEEQLRIANDELEKRVAERTAELEDANLNLQRSNQELQDFAYVASHDLQEPLRKIQAFGNLLQEEYVDQLGDGRDYLNRMRGAAARMSALIEDILSFSRVTTKARSFTTVDLAVVAREVIDDLETRITETGAIVEIGKLPKIDADAMQIRQLFQNLIANALKFHKPEVPPEIKINATTEISQDDHKKVCIITIEDNGVGFDEKYLDRIFAVFQRLHSRDSYEGTGIGLAVCRKIVERHGGSITAASKPGIGATFIIKLPVRHKKGETL